MSTSTRSMIQIRDAIAAGEITAGDAIERTVRKTEEVNPQLNCFNEVYADRAREQAAQIDKRIAAGDSPGPVAGVPIALKDNIVTDFGRTTCSSRILENFHCPYTATAAQKLIDAGAIIIGKTNCDEFAMGSSNEHSASGPARNPHDRNRVTGGSSGGSAAAVVAELCAAALGSETGGSTRQPAALCGCVGLKPSYGRVSRHGLVAFGSSLDQIGPLTSTVKDAAFLLKVIAGWDRNDSTSAQNSVPDYLEHIDEPLSDLRVGVAEQYLSDRNHPAVNDAVENAKDVYTSLGATIVDIDFPMTDYGISTYYIIAAAEASSNLARYDGIRYGRRAELEPGENLFDLYAKSRAEGFGPEVQRRIMLGTYVLSAGYYDAYYKKALQVRRLISEEYDRAFEKCHVLLGPTSPVPAFAIGSKSDPLEMYLCDLYTVNTSIAGICSVSLPCGFVEENGTKLPLGVQLQAKAFDETILLRAGQMFESAIRQA